MQKKNKQTVLPISKKKRNKEAKENKKQITKLRKITIAKNSNLCGNEQSKTTKRKLSK